MGNAAKPPNSLSWQNVSQAHVIRHLLGELYRFQTRGGDQIVPGDVMIISPYKDQRKLIGEVLAEDGIEYRDNLTIDAAQGSEAPLVIFSMTKPSADASKVGFIADVSRLNVALSRAQKVLVIIGNLKTWNTQAIKDLKTNALRRNRCLMGLLEDVTAKRHTLTWADIRTVGEADPPGGSPVQYFSHDRAIRPPRTVSAPSIPLAPLTAAQAPPPPRSRAPLARVHLPSADLYGSPAVGPPAARVPSPSQEEDVEMGDAGHSPMPTTSPAQPANSPRMRSSARHSIEQPSRSRSPTPRGSREFNEYREPRSAHRQDHLDELDDIEEAAILNEQQGVNLTRQLLELRRRRVLRRAEEDRERAGYR